MLLHYKRRGVDGDRSFNEISLSTRTLIDVAKSHGIKCTQIPYTGLFRLEYAGKKEYLHSQPPSTNTRTSVYCCNNKAITKSLLREHKLSVPKGFVIKRTDHIEYWLSVYDALQKPLVVKPIDSSLAKNVYTGITSKQSYLTALRQIYKYYGDIHQDLLVEEMFQGGTEYRIIVTKQKVVGIMSRIPANVVGDGTHTIEELVDIKNQHPWRGGDYALHQISIGKEEKQFLRQNMMSVNTVLAKNQKAMLRNPSTTNINNGGDTIDHTNKAHPSVHAIVLATINAIPGLEWAGIDFFSKDITKPQNKSTYTILEVNTSPNIAWQEFPAIGGRRQIALEYLKVVFPSLKTRKQVPTSLHNRPLKKLPLTNLRPHIAA